MFGIQPKHNCPSEWYQTNYIYDFVCCCMDFYVRDFHVATFSVRDFHVLLFQSTHRIGWYFVSVQPPLTTTE